MQIEPRIETLASKKLVGMRLRMTLSVNKTGELWRSFMPRRREIKNSVSGELFSLQVYKQPGVVGNLHQEFEKWAAVEVPDFNVIPGGMECLELPGGPYAVFHYKGSSADTSIFQYIFSVWLPNSNYTLDDRPHFEVLGEKYRNNDPNSEEEIWIPIK